MARTLWLGVATCLAMLSVVTACDPSISRTNPYDPKTPVELQRRGQISGTVRLEGASSHAGIFVALVGRNDLDAVTDASGAYLLTGVPPGTYVLVATFPDARYVTSTSAEAVTLAIGEEVFAPDFLVRKRPDPPLVVGAERASSTSIKVYLNRSKDPDVVAHRVHTLDVDGTRIVAPVTTLSEDQQLVVEVPGLSRGEQYIFQATAIDADSLESDPSLFSAWYFIVPLPAQPWEVRTSTQAIIDFDTLASSDLIAAADGLSAYHSETTGGRVRRIAIDSLTAPTVTDCNSVSPDCVSFAGIGRNPGSMAIDPTNGELFVNTVEGASGNAAVVVVDTSTGEVTDTLLTGLNDLGPVGWLDELNLLVAGSSSEAELALASRDGSILDFLTGEESYVTRLWASGSVIVYTRFTSPVLFVKELTRDVAGTSVVSERVVPLPGLPRGFDCARSINTCVVSTQAGYISFIDTSTWTITATISAGSEFQDVVVAADGLAYAVQSASSLLSVINVTRHQLLQCTPACFLPTGLLPEHVITNVDGGRILVSARSTETGAKSKVLGYAY